MDILQKIGAFVVTTILAIAGVTTATPILGGGSGTINQLDQWSATTSPTSAITQQVFGKSIKITGLDDGCLGLSSGIVTSSGSACGSGSGSGFSTTSADYWFTQQNTDALPQGATNLYWTSSLFDSAFSSKTTSDLSEGSNLYYTDSRVGSYISGSSTIPHVGGSAFGDLQYWTGSAWATRATSTLGLPLNSEVVHLTGNESIDGVKTFTSFPEVSGTATTSNQLVNYSTVSALLLGVSRQQPAVRAASTVNGTLATAFENGDTMDGVTLATGDRILIKNQSTQAENGIYTVNASGAPTRATDFDSTSEADQGALVTVLTGTDGANTLWVQVTNDPVIGTDPLVFNQLPAAAAMTASAGIQIVGSDIRTNLLTSGGLYTSANQLGILHDNTTLATSTGFLAVKDLGITNAKIANSTINLTTKVTGALPTGNGGTNLTTASDDNIMVGNGTTWQSKSLPSCSGASSALTYDQSANTVGCNTISGGSSSVASATTTSEMTVFGIPNNVSTTRAWSAMPAAATELFGATTLRTKFDTTYASAYKIKVYQAVQGTGGADLNLQCSDTNASSWTAADAVSGAGEVDVGTGANVIKIGSVAYLTSSCKGDKYWRIVGKQGNAVNSPSFAWVLVEFYTPSGGISTSRTLTTTYPLTGGGDLSADRTFALAFGTTTTNTWSNLQTLTSGFLSAASSTINGQANVSNLNSFGTATSTFAGAITVAAGQGTSTFASGISATNFNFTGSSATNTASNGINLTAGCFAINGTCVTGSGSGSGVVGSGTTGQFPYYAGAGTTLTATSSLFMAANGFLGAGTTSPLSKIHVYDDNDYTLNLQRSNTSLSSNLIRFANGTAPGIYSGYIGLYGNPTSTISTSVRLEPNGDTSAGAAWINTPVYSKITQPGVTDPSTPSTATPATGSDVGTWLHTDSQAQIYQELTTTTGITSASQVEVHVYAKSTLSVDSTTAGLWGRLAVNGTPIGTFQNFAGGTNYLSDSYAWYTLTFSGLSLTQSDIDGLQVILAIESDVLGEHQDVSIAQMYPVVTYTGLNPSASNLVFGTNPSPTVPSALTERMRITDAGLVGIGTTSPYSTLSVVGQVVAANYVGTTTATSTLGGGLSATRLLTTATSTIAGINLNAGCYAINGTCLSSGGSGTVTSVDMTVPTGLSISGNPITTSGTLALTYASGYAGVLTASTTNWNSFYDTPSTRITAGTGLSWSGNTLNASGGSSASSTLLSDNNTWSGTNNFTANLGVGTSSPYSKLSIAGQVVAANFVGTTTATSSFGGPLVVTSSATSTLSNGFNISGGCYAIAGTCISGGTGAAQSPWTGNIDAAGFNLTNAGAITGTVLSATSTSNASTITYRLGIASTTPGTALGVNGAGVFTDTVTATRFVGTSTATSTLAGGLQALALNVTGSASSTFANGINLSAGCFSVNGTCLSTSGGGSGTINSGTTGQFPFYNGSGTTLTATSSIFISQAGLIGVGTTTPLAGLHVSVPSIPVGNVGSGGTITTYSSGGTTYKVHTFTTGGTFTAPTSGTANVQVLVVAGGGGGGAGSGGGGGAGGVQASSTYNVTSGQSISVTVGAGGTGGTGGATPTRGNVGSDSVFGLITAAGGGYGGGGGDAATPAGGNGGSGGGSGGGGAGINAGGTGSQGSNGGTNSFTANCYGSGGGGGNTTSGAVGGSGGSGNGGTGTTSSITGSSVSYAGGGGGGIYNGGGCTAGTGGTGGGGTGASTNAAGTAGTANTGGGGGGGWRSTDGATNSAGGDGGSGIVIVSYPVSGISTAAIFEGGNVGIGTSSPYAKLSVVGSIVADNYVATSTATSTFTGPLAIGTTTPTGSQAMLSVKGVGATIAQFFTSTGTKVMEVLDTGVTTLLGTWDFSGATVKMHTYPAFSYPTSTPWTGTTTRQLGPAYTAETWLGMKCFTDTGTVNVSVYDGSNRMNMFNASTTVGTVALTTNNSFTASEKRYVDIGTPSGSPTMVSCTVDKVVN